MHIILLVEKLANFEKKSNECGSWKKAHTQIGAFLVDSAATQSSRTDLLHLRLPHVCLPYTHLQLQKNPFARGPPSFGTCSLFIFLLATPAVLVGINPADIYFLVSVIQSMI